MLTHFMFPPKTQHTFVSKLSGGEKRRLYLLMVLMKNPNFLILDEPTNDLDLLTLNKLEEFLLQFSGCLIIVSHDRYFMDKLTDHLFVFKGNGEIKDEYCSYSEYREKQILEEKLIKEQKVKISEDKSVEKKTNKVSYKDKFEYEQLDKDIEILEKQKQELENELQKDGLSFDDINTKSEELGKIIQTLDEKTLRWLELDELM
jgi:ATP-binding cassette subfamily F protein uup